MDSSFNLFDLGIAIVIGVSALLSFYRGFIREIFSLGGWVVASLATLTFLEPATRWVKPHVGSAAVASGIAAIGLFFLTLILFSIVTGLIFKILKPGEKVGLLDNLVGLSFGVARGVLMVAIGFFILTKFFTNEKDYPKMVQQSFARPYAEKAATWIATLAPDYLDKILAAESGTKKPRIEKNDPNSSKFRELIQGMEKKPSPILTKNIETLNGGNTDEDMPDSALPSMEDLQQRIKQENEKK